MKKVIRELGTYGLASAAGLVADVGLLTLFVSVLHVHYLVAATVSFICGGIIVYAMSVTFVFHYRRVESRALELSAFVALGAAGLLVNAVAMYFAVGALHLHFLLGKLLAASGTFATNFVLRRHFLFSPVTASRPGNAHSS